MTKEIFDVKEVAQYLHISVALVRKLIRKNEIPYYRIASKILFEKNHIEKWLENFTNVSN